MTDTRTDLYPWHPDGSISYKANGYGEACPVCHEPLTPGQARRVMPGVWRPHHEACWPTDELLCDWCGEHHPPPHDGLCLL